MQDIKKLKGMQLPPYSFEIEKGKVKEFAEAIGDDNPIYFDVDKAKSEGYKGIPIPFTFLTAVEFWGGAGFVENLKRLQLNTLNVLHGEQEFEHLKEINVGDTLTVFSKISDVYVKKGSSGEMEFLTLKCQFINQYNEVVANSKTVAIHRQ